MNYEATYTRRYEYRRVAKMGARSDSSSVTGYIFIGALIVIGILLPAVLGLN